MVPDCFPARVVQLRIGILRAAVDSLGYPRVVLCANPTSRYGVRVHILVAEAWIGPRKPKIHVNHKDLDKTNNHIDNLEYATPKENAQHWVKTRTNWTPPRNDGERNPRCKLKDNDIREIRRLHRRDGVAPKDIAAMFGVSSSHVSNLLQDRFRPTPQPDDQLPAASAVDTAQVA